MLKVVYLVIFSSKVIKRSLNGRAKKRKRTVFLFSTCKSLFPYGTSTNFLQIASGLQGLHAAGFVHGNLSPKNIALLRKTLRTKLLVSTFIIGGKATTHAIGRYLYGTQNRGIQRSRQQKFVAKKAIDSYAWRVAAFELLKGKSKNDRANGFVLGKPLYDSADTTYSVDTVRVLQSCRIGFNAYRHWYPLCCESTSWR